MTLACSGVAGVMLAGSGGAGVMLACSGVAGVMLAGSGGAGVMLAGSGVAGVTLTGVPLADSGVAVVMMLAGSGVAVIQLAGSGDFFIFMYKGKYVLVLLLQWKLKPTSAVKTIQLSHIGSLGKQTCSLALSVPHEIS